MMTRATLNTITRDAAMVLPITLALATAGGCSFFESAPTAKAPTEPPIAELADIAQAADTQDTEEFFDPFDSETPNTPGFTTVAASNTPEAWVNPSTVSVYGEMDASDKKTPRRYDGAENLLQVSFATEGADFDPDITRDGKFVLYASTQHRETSDVYIKRVGARAVTQLTADPGNDVMPTFSPSSERVAFASDRAGSWDIYVMSVTGGQPVQITDEPSHELHPTWSPDGAKLAFCRLSARSGRWEIWVVDAANPSLKQFVGYGLFPEWSPVGDKILFQRNRERGDRLFTVWTIDYKNDEGSNPTEIISSPVAAIVNPSWSDDGRRIAFATIPYPSKQIGERPAASDVWIINLDGSGRANLTGGRFVNLMPTWGPNNSVFFISDRSGRENIWSLTPEKAILAATPGQPTNLANVPTDND